MAVKGTLTIYEKDSPKTLAQPEIAQPETKKIKEAMLDSRVVVISPYNPINTFFESEVPKLGERFYVEVIDKAEKNYPPYINAAEREYEKAKPYLIIDFQKITSLVIKRIVNENERIRKRRIALSELIREYADSVEQGKVVGPEIYTQEEKPTEVQKKTTTIAKGLVEMLDEKLQKFWERADKEACRVASVYDIVQFQEYQNWALSNNIYYTAPNANFSKTLEKRIEHDSEGNFLHNFLDITDFLPSLREDISVLLNKNELKKLSLFTLKADKTSSLNEKLIEGYNKLEKYKNPDLF